MRDLQQPVAMDGWYEELLQCIAVESRLGFQRRFFRVCTRSLGDFQMTRLPSKPGACAVNAPFSSTV